MPEAAAKEVLIGFFSGTEIEIGYITHDVRGLPLAKPYPIGVRVDGSEWASFDDILRGVERLKNG